MYKLLDELRLSSILFDVFMRDVANNESISVITNTRDIISSMLYI